MPMLHSTHASRHSWASSMIRLTSSAATLSRLIKHWMIGSASISLIVGSAFAGSMVCSLVRLGLALVPPPKHPRGRPQQQVRESVPGVWPWIIWSRRAW
ncbi:exported hypothetical protein [Mesorhizobium sp. STM 4661]|nr:exported hypothetical protein [Mesorhizobium sp. STM 4661]